MPKKSPSKKESKDSSDTKHKTKSRRKRKPRAPKPHYNFKDFLNKQGKGMQDRGKEKMPLSQKKNKKMSIFQRKFLPKVPSRYLVMKTAQGYMNSGNAKNAPVWNLQMSPGALKMIMEAASNHLFEVLSRAKMNTNLRNQKTVSYKDMEAAIAQQGSRFIRVCSRFG